MKNNKNIVQKSFTFDENQLEYTIKIKKRCKWCWLLLLLPLLLLLRCNDNIDYILMDNCNKNSEISISYNDNKGKTHKKTKKTNSQGEVNFTIKGRQLYEIIFGIDAVHNFKITANATDNKKIIASNTGFLKELIKQKNKLITAAVKDNFVVKVVNAKDENINIGNADITLKYRINGKKTTLNGKTDANGNCNFKIPECAETIELYGKKINYHRDSLKTDFASAKINPDKRKLKLKPKEKKKPQPPQKNCRAYFTGRLVGERVANVKGIVIPFIVDAWSEYVGAGEYPDNNIAFPKAVASTFDGIAIGSKTRVIIYSKKNFQGDILFDREGPLVVNNKRFKNSYGYCNTITFPVPEIQAIFPPNVREWSETEMHSWSYGSLKIICK